MVYTFNNIVHYLKYAHLRVSYHDIAQYTVCLGFWNLCISSSFG